MKQLPLIFLLFFSGTCFAQSEKHLEKYNELEPDLWMGILDKEHSDQSIQIDTLHYDDIPKQLDFRGTVVEALQWQDANGENILIQSVTGHFNWKDYYPNSTDYGIEDKSEIYAYLFVKKQGQKEFKRKWRIYDYNKCYGVDWFTGFVRKATTVTDLDKNGVAEISMPYVLMCRGGLDPATLKIIMYEDDSKYALRGVTKILNYGGEFEESKNLKSNPIFRKFLHDHWKRNSNERAGGFYYKE